MPVHETVTYLGLVFDLEFTTKDRNYYDVRLTLQEDRRVVLDCGSHERECIDDIVRRVKHMDILFDGMNIRTLYYTDKASGVLTALMELYTRDYGSYLPMHKLCKKVGSYTAALQCLSTEFVSPRNGDIKYELNYAPANNLRITAVVNELGTRLSIYDPHVSVYRENMYDAFDALLKKYTELLNDRVQAISRLATRISSPEQTG